MMTPSPLPLSWVDSLFARMAVRYGAQWLAKWNGVDIAAVKADWAETLAGISEHAIRYALVNLPIEYPPTATQFREICLRRPDEKPPQLPAPKASPESVAKVRRAMHDLAAMWAHRKPRQWAEDLRARRDAGERLSSAQLAALARADQTHEPAEVGKFAPIQADCLPPAMRPASERAEPPIHAYDDQEAHA